MAKCYSGKTVWITGASSGIGEAIAYEFARNGAKLILSSRGRDDLERVSKACKDLGSESYVYTIDLSESSQIEKIAEDILKNHQQVDILVNNGGISQRSLVLETPVDIDRKIMEIDFFGGVVLTKKVLPRMIERQSGHIVVISSITGLFGFPQRSAYSAAKHAINGFYEALWAELHQQGINVSIICPGRIRTNISINALTGSGLPYGTMDHGQNSGLSPEECAKRIMKAVKRKKVIVYVGRKEIIMVYIKRYFPWLFYKLVSKVKPN
jgi:short-subunit dehydrogenase